MAQQFRQLGDIHRNPQRLIARFGLHWLVRNGPETQRQTDDDECASAGRAPTLCG
jgi:hypothetical protein